MNQRRLLNYLGVLALFFISLCLSITQWQDTKAENITLNGLIMAASADGEGGLPWDLGCEDCLNELGQPGVVFWCKTSGSEGCFNQACGYGAC